jgi:hypothetical protein
MPTPGFGDPDPGAAAAVADRFLAGIRSCDLVERQRLLSDIIWPSLVFRYAAFVFVETLHEDTFATDIDGVRGYQRLLQAHVPLRVGVAVTKLYQLVAYPERRSGKWRVWSFEEAPNVAWAYSCEWLPPAQAEDEHTSIVRYAECLSVSGRLNEALAAYGYAAELSASDPGGEVPVALDDVIRALRRIIGK